MSESHTHLAKGLVVTVDGPTASGKGTLARHLAKHYRMKYLDTGCLYRALAYYAVQQGVEEHSYEDIAALAPAMPFDFKHVGQNKFETFLDGGSVEKNIRTPQIDTLSSQVAIQPVVRQALLAKQTGFAEAWKNVYGVILDGRDCGARIYPAAQVKIFLQAAPETRAERRFQEMQQRGVTTSYDEIYQSLLKRDARDKPNTLQTEDAHVLDATQLGIEQVVAQGVALIENKLQRGQKAV